MDREPRCRTALYVQEGLRHHTQPPGVIQGELEGAGRQLYVGCAQGSYSKSPQVVGLEDGAGWEVSGDFEALACEASHQAVEGGNILWCVGHGGEAVGNFRYDARLYHTEFLSWGCQAVGNAGTSLFGSSS